MKKRIAEAVAKFGLKEKDIVTVKELETVAKEAGVDLIDVMWYLRYVR